MMEPKASLIYRDGKVNFEISLNGELVNLTDLWRAAGSIESKRPYRWWILPQTTEFVATVKSNCRKSTVIETRRGYEGGTFAHWQIAIAYAKYLSPAMHIWANEELWKHFQAEQNPEWAATKYMKQTAQELSKQGFSEGEIDARLRAIIDRKGWVNAAKSHGLTSYMEIARTSEDVNKAITGMKSYQIRKRFGVKRTRDALIGPKLALINASEVRSIELFDKLGASTAGQVRSITKTVAETYAEADRKLDRLVFRR